MSGTVSLIDGHIDEVTTGKTCKDCIHYDVCQALEDNGQVSKIHPIQCGCFKDKSRFVELPCKVGDRVYQIKYCRCGNPECFEMKHCYKKDTKKTPKVYGSIMLRQDGKRLKPKSYMFEKPQWEWRPIGTICYKIIQKPFELKLLTEFGKTVFLTKEEAEVKLKELQNEK